MDRSTLLAFAGLFAFHVATQFVEVPFWTFSLFAASSTVFIGSKLAASVHDKDDDRYGKKEDVERLSQRDVAMFPIVGSASLLGIYVCVKFLSEYYLNLLARGYFAMIGTFVVAKTLSAFLPALLPTSTHSTLVEKPIFTFNMRKIPFSSYFLEDGDDADLLEVTIGGSIMFLLSLLISAGYLQTNHWMLSNIFGVCFSIQALIFIDVGSFRNGAILLCALFLYDIFWVFGTEVMVTVATKFDVPIKLLFPRGENFALLGLGDIVLPGLFVALMARFDTFLRNEKKKAEEEKASRVTAQAPPAPIEIPRSSFYFYVTLFGYVFGLAFTLFINVYFEAPQPALLYLVPGVLLTSMGASVVRGESSELFAYVSEEEKEKTAKKAAAEKSE